MLDCLRLILQLADDVARDENIVSGMRAVIAEVAQAQDPSNDSTKYVARCLTSMTDIKAWLQKLMDRLSGASVIGNAQQLDLEEGIEYQRVSLVGQHETLSIIVLYMTKLDYSSVSNFELMLERLRIADKYDHLLRKPNRSSQSTKLKTSNFVSPCREDEIADQFARSSLFPCDHRLHISFPQCRKAAFRRKGVE